MKCQAVILNFDKQTAQYVSLKDVPKSAKTKAVATGRSGSAPPPPPRQSK